MTLRSADDLKNWKYCSVCSYPLIESKKLVDDDAVTSFDVGCKNGHHYTLVQDHLRGEVALRATAPRRMKRSPKADTGPDSLGLCWICGRLPDEHGRCPVHG